jgi:hypothetical protein
MALHSAKEQRSAFAGLPINLLGLRHCRNIPIQLIQDASNGSNHCLQFHNLTRVGRISFCERLKGFGTHIFQGVGKDRFVQQPLRFLSAVLSLQSVQVTPPNNSY